MMLRKCRSINTVLCLIIIAGLTACGKSVSVLPKGGSEALKKLKDNYPSSSNKLSDWDLKSSWNHSVDENGELIISGDSKTITVVWNDKVILKDSWFISVEVDLEGTYSEDGAAELILGNDKNNAIFSLKIMSAPAGFSKIGLYASSSGKNLDILNSGWIPGNNNKFIINISKDTGESPLLFNVYGDQGLRYDFDTKTLSQRSDDIKKFGIGIQKAAASFTNIICNSNYNLYGQYVLMAKTAVDDLLFNFWRGGPSTGHTLPTWNGYPSDVLPDPRGGLWERGMLMLCMDSLYKVTGDPVLKERIISEWRRIKELYSIEELEAAGSSLHPACDDCGWHANLYLLCYEYSGDEYALDRAEGMIRNTYAHFMDDELGGGLWYNNDRSYKSLYQLGVVLASLTINKYRPNDELLDLAVKTYEWTEENLIREDDIYWCEVNRDGPVGKERPDDITLAGSVSFLGGNMAMAVAHARMYEMTGEDKYLQRAVRTVSGITEVFRTDTGVFLNDRDAWANGTFMRLYVTEALTLKGIPKKCIDIVYKTAESIYANARTGEGYYGGCWQGPADGPGCRWSMKGSRPAQIMTSGSTVNIMAGAALLEALSSVRTGDMK